MIYWYNGGFLSHGCTLKSSIAMGFSFVNNPAIAVPPNNLGYLYILMISYAFPTKIRLDF